MSAGYLAFLVAVFLLGFLAGGPVWTWMALSRAESRLHLAQ